jgi:hypothetical protein
MRLANRAPQIAPKLYNSADMAERLRGGYQVLPRDGVTPDTLAIYDVQSASFVCAMLLYWLSRRESGGPQWQKH